MSKYKIFHTGGLGGVYTTLVKVEGSFVFFNIANPYFSSDCWQSSSPFLCLLFCFYSVFFIFLFFILSAESYTTWYMYTWWYCCIYIRTYVCTGSVLCNFHILTTTTVSIHIQLGVLCHYCCCSTATLALNSTACCCTERPCLICYLFWISILYFAFLSYHIATSISILCVSQ